MRIIEYPPRRQARFTPIVRAASTILIASTVGFYGYYLGAASHVEEQAEPVPTPTVYVTLPPEVVTETEIKEVPVHAPIPQSCTDLLQAVTDMRENDGELTAAAGKISLSFSEVQKYAMANEAANLTIAIEAMHEARRDLDLASEHRGIVGQTLTVIFNRCEADLNE